MGSFKNCLAEHIRDAIPVCIVSLYGVICMYSKAPEAFTARALFQFFQENVNRPVMNTSWQHWLWKPVLLLLNVNSVIQTIEILNKSAKAYLNNIVFWLNSTGF